MTNQTPALSLQPTDANGTVEGVQPGWSVLRVASLFRQVNEPGEDHLPVLSISIHHGISDRELEAEERDRKVSQIEDKKSYKRVKVGDLAYNMMRAWQGALGVTKVDGLVSPAYIVARQTGILHAPFFEYLIRSPLYVEKMRASSRGITDFRLRLYWEHFRQIVTILPPLETQEAVSHFLNRETARIDQLIKKKEKIADLIRTKWEALIHDARSEPEAKWVRFKTVAHRTQRPIGEADDASYVPLGLYNRGRGFFKKVKTDEEDLGDSDFFWVREGDIVFSGQFAWEGAIGFVTAEEDGCVVSHRYPVYRSNDGIEGAYLYAFFRTAHGAFLMDNCSRGAAGRNRPLNTWSIERELVLICSERTQNKIARLVALESKARQLVRQYTAKASELKAALITAAVTGEIDVTTFDMRGNTDRRLQEMAP